MTNSPNTGARSEGNKCFAENRYFADLKARREIPSPTSLRPKGNFTKDKPLTTCASHMAPRVIFMRSPEVPKEPGATLHQSSRAAGGLVSVCPRDHTMTKSGQTTRMLKVDRTCPHAPLVRPHARMLHEELITQSGFQHHRSSMGLGKGQIKIWRELRPV